ncbi:phosphate acyltransferase PlsX [Dialister sp.]|jgi:glycerol-3-phosphate acyltransferase PlsX|uniref:phosphate acyltransferase PlsX n=1 Tax=Dialister sp. TaxID=1955814 RepID=UPI0025FCECBD|nr:phosphate acyltransferase PlsX [Dialister sp.]
MDKIAVDAMGGDFAPLEIVLGALQAVREYKIPVVLVGDEERISKILREHHEESNPLVEIHHASQVIEMGEHPGMAFRKKKDASISVGARLVKNGTCGALVAPGSTGAAVTAGLLGIGRIKGIERPAILTPIPNEKGGYTYLIDSGASAQPKMETYVQNALLGYIYAKKVAGIDSPRVGLLNIGAESAKGSPLVAEANGVLSRQNIIPFAGNAEGRDVMTGDFDVIVTDGFTGNVVLKFGEGAGKLIASLLKEAVMQGGLRAKLGGLLLKPALKKYVAKRLDYAEYGGAPLLGIRGVLLICHGASKAKAIKNAIRMARDVCNEHLDQVVTEALTQMKNEEMQGSAD